MVERYKKNFSQILRGRDRHRSVLPAHARHRVPRFEAGQRAARPGRTHQDC